MGKVLVLDNKISDRTRVARYLGAYHEVLTAARRSIAAKTLAKTPVDVLVVPEAFGAAEAWPFIADIRRLSPETSVVVVATDPDFAMAQRAAEMGEVVVVPRPVTGADFERLRAAVDHGVASAEVQRHVRATAATAGLQKAPPAQLLGTSEAMGKVRAAIEEVAHARSVVLVEGPAGVGKELVARHVHAKSRFRNGPFLVVALAALDPGQVESELFGHEKGAFKGAEHRHIGFLEAANTGTLFLTEVTELQIELQRRLQKALERREVTRLGGGAPSPIDVQLIAAAAAPLEPAIEAGAFDVDFYMDLSRGRIVVPALRERPEDIAVVAADALAETTRRFGLASPRGITADAVQLLESYAWPGNERELRAFVRQLVVGCRRDEVCAIDVYQELPGRREAGGRADDFETPLRDRLREFEKDCIRAALAKTAGNAAQAAALCEESVTTFHTRMKRYHMAGIRPSGRPPRPVGEAPEVTTRRGPRSQVLLVDDSADVRSSVRRHLVKDNDITEAESGEHALTLFERGHVFDAVMCDLVMSGIGGLELYRRVVAAHPALADAFLFVSGNLDAKTTKALEEETGRRVLCKPVDVEELRGAIREVARARAAKR